MAKEDPPGNGLSSRTIEVFFPNALILSDKQSMADYRLPIKTGLGKTYIDTVQTDSGTVVSAEVET